MSDRIDPGWVGVRWMRVVCLWVGVGLPMGFPQTAKTRSGCGLCERRKEGLAVGFFFSAGRPGWEMGGGVVEPCGWRFRF